MNPQSVINQPIVSQLEPLRTPQAIGWWPPAPGWWVLALLALAALVALGRWAWRFYRRGAPLRQARARLADIARSTGTARERMARLATLQRQVAIRVAGRGACAGLTGVEWSAFLNKLARGERRYFDDALAELPYRPEVREDESERALNATRDWLRALERPA